MDVFISLFFFLFLLPHFQIEQMEAGEPGRYRVTARTTEGAEIVDEYNTVSTLVIFFCCMLHLFVC